MISKHSVLSLFLTLFQYYTSFWEIALLQGRKRHRERWMEGGGRHVFLLKCLFPLKFIYIYIYIQSKYLDPICPLILRLYANKNSSYNELNIKYIIPK